MNGRTRVPISSVTLVDRYLAFDKICFGNAEEALVDEPWLDHLVLKHIRAEANLLSVRSSADPTVVLILLDGCR